MVEFGPYIEFRCEPYVQQAYVIRCVAIGLALVALAHILIMYYRKKRSSWRPGADS